MSHIMPDRVAGLIPSQRPKPPAPAVTPVAVAMFSASQRPASQIEASVTLSDVERELKRLRPIVSVEDQGDREELLGRYAAANKTLSAVPLRQSTEVLS